MTGTAWAPKCHIIARLRIKTFDGFFEPSSFIFSSPECHFLGKTPPRSIMFTNLEHHASSTLYPRGDRGHQEGYPL
jgi:hypothetical protein